MKKSLLALLLALIMCLSLFTGCASSNEEEGENVLKDDTEKTAMTLTLYAPTKGTTTEKEIQVVQEAFNTITQSKFNTNVVLKLIPEDEYEGVIQTTIDNIHKQKEAEESAEQSRADAEREAMLRGETLADETEAPKETQAADGAETPEISYPAVKENQLDIFLVNSFETYYDLAIKGELSPIDEEIAEGSKLLNSYVYPYLLRAAKVDGTTYGVFNNTVFGGYQYLLLNKELVDKYNYDPEKMKNVSSISMFLQEVKKNEPDVVPFLGDLEAPIIYWNDQPSIIGAFVGNAFSASGAVDATSYRPEALYPGNLFNSSAFRDWATQYNELYQAGCIVGKTEENANSKFAATVIEGDVTLSPTYADVYGNYKVDEYGFKYITDKETGVDYYVSVYKRPVADNKNVFGAGYVISAYTEDVSRCMEIITCLNTDAQLSNILMYGVKDIHYTIDETTNIVHKTTNSYAMDIRNVGNIFLLNPSDDMDEYWTFMSANKWENAKNTNREAIMSPFLGYYFNPEKPLEEDLMEGQKFVDMTFEEVYAEVVTRSQPYIEGWMTFKNNGAETFATFLQKSRAAIGDDDMFETLNDYKTGIYYMLSPYNEWYQKHYSVTLGQG